MKTHYHADDALLELKYPDSLFDIRLFLTGDGRKRGLWVWLEENHEDRIEADATYFKRGLEDFMKDLRSRKKLPDDFEMLMLLKHTYFSYFFDHRTEASAIRLSWKQVKQLAAALKKGEKDETEKTEEEF